MAATQVAVLLKYAQLQADAGPGAPMLAVPHPMTNHKLFNKTLKATASSPPLATMLIILLWDEYNNGANNDNAAYYAMMVMMQNGDNACKW